MSEGHHDQYTLAKLERGVPYDWGKGFEELLELRGHTARHISNLAIDRLRLRAFRAAARIADYGVRWLGAAVIGCAADLRTDWPLS